MSYNYSVQKKKTDVTKYSLSNIELDSQTFIFELLLKDKFNNIKVIRKIMKNNHGNLVSQNDNINYSIIDKYKLSVININNPDKPIIVKNTINHQLTTNTYLNNNIYLEINKVNNLLNLNYNINI